MSVSHDLFAMADQAHERKDYETAYNLFLECAESENTSAMSRLSLMYCFGEYVDCDYKKALYWDKKAYDLGHTIVCKNIGITYRMMGDITSAKTWFQRALEHHHNDAALELAKLYMVSDKEAKTVVEYLDMVINAEPLSVCEDSIEEAERLKENYE